MDFCRVIALNVCMYGNESNDRIDFFNEILCFSKFELRYGKYQKFHIEFFYGASSNDHKFKNVLNRCYNKLLYEYYKPMYSNWVKNEDDYKIYEKSLIESKSKLITALTNKSYDKIGKKNKNYL